MPLTSKEIRDKIQEIRKRHMQGLFEAGRHRAIDCSPCKYLDFWDDMYQLIGEIDDSEKGKD